MSVNLALANVSNIDVVRAVREMPDLASRMRAVLSPLMDLTKTTPMPWPKETLDKLWKLDEPLKAAQRLYDDRLAVLNQLLESYVAGDDLDT